jgi:adenylyltransferase/sulfurtransferase
MHAKTVSNMHVEPELRYARHLLLPELNPEAHERLHDSHVLVVGAGGLGSAALYYLAAAGIGHLGIVDCDVVEASNLQRQILHTTADIGRPKTQSAAEKLRALNPSIEVIEYQMRFDESNALQLLAEYEVAVTGVDNFSSRYLLNDACVLAGKTLAEASVLRFAGMALTIAGGHTACYRCLFPEEPPPGRIPGASDVGVFGPAAGLLGVVQASEVIKVLVGCGEPLYNRLLNIDLLQVTFDITQIERDSDCPVCGDHPTITALA